LRRAERFVPYWLLAPALAVEVVLVIGPLLVGRWYSLHDVRFFQLRRFVGLDNYWRVLGSEEVVKAIRVTTVFAFFALFLTFILGFALAVWVERDERFSAVMRAVVLMP
jgi:ABC-type sugar transport system permease subunit